MKQSRVLLVDEQEEEGGMNFSAIEFYSDNSIRLYDIDSSYIDQLLGTYAANSSDVREEIRESFEEIKQN